MPLDGLRAWIGEVERKLGMRTRVFLALAAIAIGGAGAAIYLAQDARDSAVSESDVQALQEQLEAQIGSGGSGADLATLKAELSALRAEVQQLGGGGESSTPNGSGASGGKDTAAGGEGPSGASLPELIEKAKTQSEQAETEQSER